MQDRRAPRKEADRRTSSPDRVSTVRARAADTHVALVTHDPFRNSGERAVTFRGKISACLEMSSSRGAPKQGKCRYRSRTPQIAA
jgi:hypothetical protein